MCITYQLQSKCSYVHTQYIHAYIHSINQFVCRTRKNGFWALTLLISVLKYREAINFCSTCYKLPTTNNWLLCSWYTDKLWYHVILLGFTFSANIALFFSLLRQECCKLYSKVWGNNNLSQHNFIVMVNIYKFLCVPASRNIWEQVPPLPGPSQYIVMYITSYTGRYMVDTLSDYILLYCWANKTCMQATLYSEVICMYIHT